MHVTTRDGQKKLRRSTKGWKFLVEYSNGRKQWMQLSDLKETFCPLRGGGGRITVPAGNNCTRRSRPSCIHALR
eukprot:scaffold12131_cov124-Skeletonema_dohrnii-CCMP3373.AAC.4